MKHCIVSCLSYLRTPLGNGITRGVRRCLIIAAVAGCSRAMGQDKPLVNSIGMELVRVEAGALTVGEFRPPYPVPADTMKGAERPLTMWMNEGNAYRSEHFTRAKELATSAAASGFKVRIENPFYIGRFEVTQAQWVRVMGRNPSTFTEQYVSNPGKHPVENITWEMAQAFVEALSRLEGKRYRLPTEFEWEYAARAGADGDIAWATTQKVAQLGSATTQEVGGLEPNNWGIYDMLGNVWEWVEDFYNEKTFPDPLPPQSGTTHVLKGASFTGDVKNATWLTHAGGPGNGWDVGFRVVLEISNE